MMTVQVEHGRRWRHGWSGSAPRCGRLLARNAGGCRRREGRRRDPIGLRPAQRQIDAQRAFQIQPGRQAVGRQRRLPEPAVRPRSGGSFEPTQSGDRARLGAVMQQDRCGDRACRSAASMKTSARPPGASTTAPLRARNGSAGCPSSAITRTSMIFDFYRDNIALKAVDQGEASARSWSRTVKSSVGSSVDGGDAMCVPRDRFPAAIAVAVGPSRQSSNSSTSSRSTAIVSLSATTSARAADGGGWPSPSSLTSHMKVPA